MQNTITLVTILTDNVPRLVAFYRDVMGIEVEGDSGDYVEFKMKGVRFAICDKQELVKATAHESFTEPKSGQSFEFAFPVNTPEEVDAMFVSIVEKGAECLGANGRPFLPIRTAISMSYLPRFRRILMGKMNKAWHEKNRLPKNTTLDERIAWHKSHAANCACRPIPPKIQQLIDK